MQLQRREIEPHRLPRNQRERGLFEARNPGGKGGHLVRIENFRIQLVRKSWQRHRLVKFRHFLLQPRA